MHTTDRRAALTAILLGVLIMFSLSACGKPDDAATAAQPVGAATLATSDPTTMADESAAATVTPTASATAADATVAPVAPTAISTPAAEPTPVGTATLTQTAATPSPLATGDTRPLTGTADLGDDQTDPFTGTVDLADTDDVTVTVELTTTGTLTVTHPVAIAIADHFAVPAIEIISLHADGLGFGEIARAYFLARELAADGDTTNDLAADQILAMHQDGMGWGQIVASLGLPHGNSGRNLGLIMKQHKEHPGTMGVVAAGDEPDAHGPPSVPPGHAKDKDKNKDHGNAGGNANGHGNGGGNGNGHGNGGGNGKGKGNGGGKKGK
jgi:hypothetical protein